MSYRDLVEVEYSISLDTSNLENRLDKIEEKLDGAEGFDADRVREIFSEMAHSEGEDLIERTVEAMDLSDKVRDVLDSGSYIEDGVSEYVRDNYLIDQSALDQAIDEVRGDIPDTDNIVDRVLADLPDNDEVNGILNRLADLERRFEKLDASDDERIAKAHDRLDDLERRFEMYATRVDDLRSAGGSYEARLHMLETKLAETEALLANVQDVTTGHDHKLAAMASADLTDLNRIIDAHNSLDRRVTEMQTLTEDAVTVFDLLKQAVNILIRGGRA